MALVLLTNDDGIFAPGINALRARMEQIPGLEVWAVAPDRERSASGHAITTYRPLFPVRVEIPGAVAPCISVTGTPADSAKLAIEAILPRRPDLVISGINRGANLGTDIFYSGTVAAALEGPILGIPALAVSLDSMTSSDYSAAADFAAQLALKVLEEGLPEGTLLNVNVPALPREAIKGVRVTKVGRRIYRDQWVRRMHPRGQEYYWLAGELAEIHNDRESDVSAVEAGYISVTPVHLDLTRYDQMDRLRQWNLTF
ncbi:5'/3'-nucleotidase SurE [Symbiobacterium thermophilum]|uniref:5'-nucleotidase SurE n=1 Tax=Symbiobacterium thermophilum (strain DSM 24528 / JCM 14929 / IAM 14863 / T) TaxID=292459 RepID=SURE_SYMTH|nr:5'/3'-nucleotidase SurE [Symbiobacterium thermophilum]Q67NP4.1 RecName: Full=5'-nucleotidase SurE; AltName: Full=Nucleoside 5'-monophosphate phosphohydrolase [Symbiobacterium thermophilum IAM 14863]BAD40699.1 stationary phase survival protein [Symbiobacterium thermophilum IAM 14863]